MNLERNNRFRTLITEELHVADEVKELSLYLKRYILQLIPKGLQHDFTIDNQTYSKYLGKRGYNNIDISRYAFFEELHVSVNIFNSEIRKLGSKTNIKYNTKSKGVNKNNREVEEIKITDIEMLLNLYIFNGKPVPIGFDEVIQHEVNHAL